MRYLNLEKENMVNGDGIRVLLWVSGCSHHCHNCHNPESWDPNNGEEFTEETLKNILEYMDHNYISGLTLSGGDPLFKENRETVLKIIKVVREKFGNSKTIWLWTGYTLEAVQEDSLVNQILEYVDILVDGPFIESLKKPGLLWKGSENQRVINMRETLKTKNVVIYR